MLPRLFNCYQCKKEFFRKGSTKNYTPRFCSQSCWGLSIRKDKKCVVCSNHVKWENKNCCSKKCNSLFKTGVKLSKSHVENLSLAKKGKPIKHLIENKEIISKKISVALKGKPQLWNRGKNHPNYIDGGLEKFERQKAMGRVEYKNWRRCVFERDNFTCVICSKKGSKLNADHIQSWSLFPLLRYDVNNGRTLCVDCHRKTSSWGAGSIRKKENKNA